MALPTTSSPVVPPWTRGMRLTLAAIVVTGMLLGWLARPAEISLGGDEATYIALSHSLESGRYRDEFLFGAPPHAQYPPGNAAWLLIVRRIAGDDLDGLRAANLVLLACIVLLLADALRRLGLRRLGVAAAAATMLNPALLALAGTALSEILYATFTSIAVWATLVVTRQSGRPRHVLAAAAAACAFLTRLMGLAMLGAVGLSALRRRQWKKFLLAGVGMAVLVVVWFWYTRTAARVAIGPTYADDLAHRPNGLWALLKHVVSNAGEFLRRTPIFQFGFPDVPGTRLDTPIFAAMLMVPALLGFPVLARRWPAAAVLLVLSGGLLLTWPWPDGRLMMPLLPWIIVSILLGTVRLATVLHSVAPERYGLAAAIVLTGCAVVTQGKAAIHGQACRHSAPYLDARCYNADARSFVAAAYFIRDSLPPSAVIATSEPATLFVLSHHQAMPLETSLTHASTAALTLNRPVTHALLSRLNAGERSTVALALRTGCRQLSLRARFAPEALLLMPRDAARDDSSDACVALERFVHDSMPDPALAHW